MESPTARLQRKIDQAYELAACARADRDKADEARWFAEVNRLKEELKEELKDAHNPAPRPRC